MRILFYGDSNTWGYNALTKNRYENRYTQLVKKACIDDEIIEEGLNGRTLAQDDPFDWDRNGAKSIQMIIKSHVPIDVLVIMLGTNDAKRIFSTNETSIYRGMRSILRQISASYLYETVNVVPKVLLVQPPRMNPKYIENEGTKLSFGQEGYEMMEKAGVQLQKLADEYQVSFLDTSNVCTAGEYDGIHLNEEGHQKLANAIVKKLEELR